LEDNLVSVSVQTYPSLEHIVMDGASTDGSVAILRNRAGRNVHWWSEPDLGQSHALNKAFGASRGEIIGWLNSDDAFFTPDTVSAVVEAFDRNPDADVVYGHAALVNADGLILHVLWAPHMWTRLLPIHNFIVQPSAFIRRRAIGDHLVDPHFAYMMDRELWLRLSDQCRFVRLNRILALDRHQPGRKSMTRLDLAALDQARLDVARPTASGPWVRPVRKVLKVAFRLAGMTRVPEAVRAQLAFKGRVDRLGSLLLRQLAMPRSRMPFDNG
jgi:glycosyltransferase involved in cell wall biosynthesis